MYVTIFEYFKKGSSFSNPYKLTVSEHGITFLRLYSESSFKQESVFCSTHTFVPPIRPGLFSKALNSEFPNLEAFICFVIDFSEYPLKEYSEHTPKYGPKKN